MGWYLISTKGSTLNTHNIEVTMPSQECGRSCVTEYWWRLWRLKPIEQLSVPQWADCQTVQRHRRGPKAQSESRGGWTVGMEWKVEASGRNRLERGDFKSDTYKKKCQWQSKVVDPFLPSFLYSLYILLFLFSSWI